MQINVPDLGVDKADVSEILVAVGDRIEKDQSLVVLESAKASVEVPSPASGVIKAILIQPGQSVVEGNALFELEEEGAASAAPASAAPAPVAAPVEAAPQPAPAVVESAPAAAPVATASSAQDVLVPDLGVDSADVSELLVAVGDEISKDQSLAVLESAKASVEVPSPFAGVVTAIHVQAGQKVQQGVLLITVQAQGSQPVAAPAASAPVAAATTSTPQAAPAAVAPASAPVAAVQPASNGTKVLTAEELDANSKVYAGPAVRQLARQLGVVLSQVQGTGLNKRIMKEDVFAFVKSQLTQKPAAAAVGAAAPSGLPPLPNFDKFGGTTSETLTRLQQVSIPQLSLNNFIPQVTQFDLADITELEGWRNQLKDGYKKEGVSLTILAFIVKALAYLLKQEKYFNSHLADDQKSVVLRNEIHIGIAVATPDGLTVPVLRNPDRLSIKEIAVELGELSKKARDKKLTPNDLQGASFTITSLGSIGGTAFTPLVNWPQVAILGISPATMQPVWNGKEFQPRLMLPLSLSYDHRVINGADGARFSNALAKLLTDIRRVLL